MPNRIDVVTEMDACERIRALDEKRLDLELGRAGIDLQKLMRLAAGPGITVPGASGASERPAHPDLVPTPAAAQAASAPELPTFELAGTVKFFDARRGYGFFAGDGNQGDVLMHVLHLRAAGHQTAYEGARIHAMVHRTSRGLQVSRILSVDESAAIHPSQIPPRTREKVQTASDWVRAKVKWYNRDKGYGFVCEGEGSPDCMVHADTLQRWGVAPLRPQQTVEIRWGMSSKGRMVAEIRCPGGLPGFPPVH
jgi:CspA family cold shock protein